MRMLRLPLIVLLTMVLDLVTPFAMSSTEAFDEVEEAIHRPRGHAAVHFVRDLPCKRKPKVRLSTISRYQGVPTILRIFVAGPSIRKLPQAVSDPPASADSH